MEYRYILTELETATNFELLISTPHKNEINTDCFAFICELYSVTEAVTGETVFLKVLQNSLPESFFSILLKKRLAKRWLWQMCFYVSFVKFLKTSFLQNTSGHLLLWLNTVSIWKQNNLYLVDVCAVLILVIYGFTKISSVMFVYIIFCFVVFNSQEILILFLILLVFNFTVVQTY